MTKTKSQRERARVEGVPNSSNENIKQEILKGLDLPQENEKEKINFLEDEGYGYSDLIKAINLAISKIRAEMGEERGKITNDSSHLQKMRTISGYPSIPLKERIMVIPKIDIAKVIESENIITLVFKGFSPRATAISEVREWLKEEFYYSTNPSPQYKILDKFDKKFGRGGYDDKTKMP